MERIVCTPFGDIEVRDTGSGPVVLLVHGIIVTADLWRETVAALGDDVRCVVPQLPLGAHRRSADPRTTLTLEGVADLIAAVLDAMDLDEVTVVGNDTGGAISQLLVARHPERITRLVLTSCELGADLPPRVAVPVVAAARSERATRAWLRLAQTRLGRRAFMSLFTARYDDELARRFLAPAAKDAAVRRELRRLLRSVRGDELVAVPAALRRWDRPVLLLWGGADRLVFPLAPARRWAAEIPNARVEVIPGARALVPLDAPVEVAGHVRRSCSAPRHRQRRPDRQPAGGGAGSGPPKT